jgi:DNA-binding NarL/FixJ family response regulator
LTDEAEQVIKAMDALEEIADPTERARAISKVLADQTKRTPRLAALRREVVVDLRAQGMSFRKIAAEIKVSLGTVQDILRGHSGSWADRPKATAKESDDAGTSERPDDQAADGS